MVNRKMVVVSLLVALFVFICAASSFATGGGKVNINTASVKELVTLEKIGKKYAEAIVDYRKANGPFKAPEDIMKVKGISQKTYDANKDRIAVE